ncbi:MAG: PKD domain-containing protein, partial [Saprospiraceae bacterium]|nr:PKD domain-containing protein [Saprospiraceae bacterium]
GPDFGYGLDVRDDVVAVTGNTMSTTMTIGSFSLPGTTSSVFVARKGEIVVSPPVAGFTAGNTSGCGPLEVTFTNTSLQSPTSFHWEFPGGTPASSTDMSPTVVYQNSGQYTVTLIATNAGGSDTLTQQQVITIMPAPDAAFSAALSGLQLTLQNQSTNANTWLWNFGDGQTSTLQNPPPHVYANCGNYTVSLISTNLCGSDTMVQMVSLGTPPNALFTHQLSGLQLTLQNQSTNANTWLWNFGDGQTSTLQNPPPHLYTNCGNYTVSLISTNLCGSDTMVQMVSLGTPPNALFTHQLSGLQLTLQNQSTGATAWLWNFGDGQTSTQQNPPPHVYANCGNYTVSLISTNLCGSDTMVQMVSLGTPPNALFTHQLSGLELTLQNQSTGATAWLWNFGDGQTSTQQNPIHIYTNCGNYTVSLISTNQCGSDTMVQMVSLGTPPNALFTHQLSGLELTLQNQSTGATAWLWNFGDGQTSTQQNPIHTYTNCGNYTVSLISTNLCGSDTMVQEISVISFPAAIFDFQIDGLELTLQNQSSNGDSWLWNFGDGQTSTLQNPPPHVYADTGVYIVTLTVTNQCGVSIFQEEIVVSQMSSAVYSPEAAPRLHIWPNPNNGVFTLEWQSEAGKQAQVRLYSASGVLLREWRLTQPQETLTVDQLPAGIYPLQLKTGKGSVWKKVVIVVGK